MLKDDIQEGLKQAMMTKDEFLLSTLRMLKSALQYYEINKGGAGYSATDDDVIDVVAKEIKKRQESVQMYTSGGRQELADKEEKEIEILKKFMPAQMSEDEVKKLVDDAVSQTGASTIQDMGKVMGALMPKVKGKADGNLVSKLVREKLS